MQVKKGVLHEPGGVYWEQWTLTSANTSPFCILVSPQTDSAWRAMRSGMTHSVFADYNTPLTYIRVCVPAACENVFLHISIFLRVHFFFFSLDTKTAVGINRMTTQLLAQNATHVAYTRAHKRAATVLVRNRIDRTQTTSNKSKSVLIRFADSLARLNVFVLFLQCT